MKKLFLIILVVVVSSAIKVFVDRLHPVNKNSEKTTEDLILQTSNKINESLPRMIDKETKLLTTIPGPGNKITYSYSFMTYTASNIDIKKYAVDMKKGIVNYSCSHKSIIPILKRGTEICHHYNGVDNILIAEVCITNKDCSQ